MKLANRSIYNLLELASAKKETITTTINHRKLGKTKALIQFAKDNKYYVLTGNETIAKLIKKEYGYRQVKGIDSMLDGLGPFFVFDECCPIEKIEKLKESGFIILTGFEKDKDFYKGR